MLACLFAIRHGRRDPVHAAYKASALQISLRDCLNPLSPSPQSMGFKQVFVFTFSHQSPDTQRATDLNFTSTIIECRIRVLIQNRMQKALFVLMCVCVVVVGVAQLVKALTLRA